MAGSVPASHTFKGDGLTRVFPISTRIIGDDYIRIEIDNIYKYDRSSWDIVNNSIIFTVAPIVNSTILIKVAESVEAVGLLDNQSTADIIEANIPVINGVYNDLSIINNVNDNVPYIQRVDGNSPNIDIVASNISNLNIIAGSLGDLKEIKNHNNLTGRNEANAHPISAITGLQETLNGISNDGGLFPSVTSEYVREGTMLSCKVSSTELKAVSVNNIISNNYSRQAYTNKYSGLITNDVYGTINNTGEESLFTMYNDQKLNINLSTGFSTSPTPLYKDPLSTYGYYALNDNTLYLVDVYSNYTFLNKRTIQRPPQFNGNYASKLIITNTYKIVMMPTSNHGFFLIYDMMTETMQKIDISTLLITNGFQDGQLHPNGKIYYTPYNAPYVLAIDPENLTYETIGVFSANNTLYTAIHLAPNGNMYSLPYKSNQILEINPYTNVVSRYGSFDSTSNKFVTQCVGIDGCIYGIMNGTTDANIYKFNPTTKDITKIDMLPLLDRTTFTGNVGVLKMKTGIDGLIYFTVNGSAGANLFSLDVRHTMCITYDITQNKIERLVNYTNGYTSLSNYMPNGEIYTTNNYIKNSNKGTHYWLMSNYFDK